MVAKLMLILCLLLSVPCALLALLIVLPAPHYLLWQATVGVSEWSLWLLLLGVVALLSCAIALWNRGSWGAWLGVALSLLTIGCALVPPVQALQVAARAGVQLSLSRYFLGELVAPTIAVQRDVEFARVGAHALKLDVYDPFPGSRLEIGPDERLPAVIVVHGGSWSGGTKGEFTVPHNRQLASERRVVFDITYRLAHADQRFPAQIADVKCAIGWVKRNAARYRVDPERIALLGRSAGGQLALLAAYTPNDPALPPSCAAPDTSVRAVISLYGPTDLPWGYNNRAIFDVLNGPAVLRNYLGGSPTALPQLYALASPIEHVGPQTPPTLFFHGGHDYLVGKQHVERIIPGLQAVGVPYEYVYLPWATHGFDFNPNGWGSQIAQAKIDAFLDMYLR